MNAPSPCCRPQLYGAPADGDLVRCFLCGTAYQAQTKPHVGVPTWWRTSG